jgi:hypothetical protein
VKREAGGETNHVFHFDFKKRGVIPISISKCVCLHEGTQLWKYR